VVTARVWVQDFERWYNREHWHSSLKSVTPEQCHRQQAPAILVERTAFYEAARSRNLARWSKPVRNWSLAESVWLNLERVGPELAKAA